MSLDKGSGLVDVQIKSGKNIWICLFEQKRGSRDSWLEELMGTVRRGVRSSAACAKPGGQLSQHLPCCLCVRSTMSLSPATEYSLRARTPLTTIWKSSSQPGPLNSYRHPWSWSWSRSWSALFLFPQTQAGRGGRGVKLPYRTVSYCFI